MIRGLPEKLKQLRLSLGYSQRAVAAKLKVSPSIISGYETGERTPSAEALLALAQLYRCSIDYLLGREPRKPAATLNVEGLTSRQVQILLDLVQEFQKGF